MDLLVSERLSAHFKFRGRVARHRFNTVLLYGFADDERCEVNRKPISQ